MPLLSLPNELLLLIIDNVRRLDERKHLLALLTTCKSLKLVAEEALYYSLHFERLASLHQVLDLLQERPDRRSFVCDLGLYEAGAQYYSGPDYPDDGTGALPCPDLACFPNLKFFVSESLNCQPWASDSRWGQRMDGFMSAFANASLSSPLAPAERPLQNLRSLVLHWSGGTDRFWCLSPTSPIFLLPRLESLELSAARIGNGRGVASPSDSELALQFKDKTNLKSLKITECSASAEALLAILGYPRALEHFDLYEISHHHSYYDGNNEAFATSNPSVLQEALDQQSQSLEHLAIRCHKPYLNEEDYEGIVCTLRLGNFPALSRLELGPVIKPNHVHHPLTHWKLDGPSPPALEVVRLNDWDVSMLKERIASAIFQELALPQLFAAAETRGASLEVEIALRSVPSYFRHVMRGTQDQRPAVRVMVDRVATLFEALQSRTDRSSAAADRSGSLDGRSGQLNAASPATNEEMETKPESPKPAAHRLRVLTSKKLNVVPPLLHGEPLPNFQTRYDTWQPGGFTGMPPRHKRLLTVIDDSSDEDSGRDEDMDAAFTPVDASLLFFPGPRYSPGQ